MGIVLVDFAVEVQLDLEVGEGGLVEEAGISRCISVARWNVYRSVATNLSPGGLKALPAIAYGLRCRSERLCERQCGRSRA